MTETDGKYFEDIHPSKLPYIPPKTSICCCFVLSVIYVGSLYIWSNKENRDHPTTIKRRCLSVLFVMLIAPTFVYKFSSPDLLGKVPFLGLLGLRWQGFLPALLIPLLLTVLLFLGPLCVQIQNRSLSSISVDFDYCKNSFTNVLWIRNYIVAPLSEEFVFRSCMMPLILQCFPPLTAVFVTPLFFGTAHVHHIRERLSMGIELKTAIIVSCFQFLYTTLFGFYSAYLFARTGHFISPFVAHAFCNHMGLPDIQELWQQHLTKRAVLIGLYILGFVGWVLLLPLATQPSLFANGLYWNV